MKLNIAIIVILGFSILFVTGNAYAPCIEGPGINCNNYPPPSLSQIKTDTLNYETSDKPIITIMGAPDAVAHLEIDDSSSNIMLFIHDINLAPNGTARYVLDISSYKPGVYSAIATSLISRLTTNFAVGLSTTGPIITLNVLKDTYVQGDFITIVGTVGRNDTVQLSLIDPNDNVVTSIQTVSNDVGQYSTSALRIPTNAISGIWKITADHDISHTTIKITVQSSASNGVMKSSGPVVITLESPLKQFKSGIALKDIKCASDFQMVIKAKNRSPACVKLDDVSKLVERGWADKPNSLQEQLDMANSCTGMTDACRHSYDAKNNDPFGITALIIYHPPDLCLNSPSHSVPSSMPSCPPNKFYLKINSNSTSYLMGYNICDDNSCTTNNTLSLILPLNTGLHPDYQMIGLLVNLQWKYGDTVRIQLYVSSTNDNKTASLVDIGNSTIVP